MSYPPDDRTRPLPPSDPPPPVRAAVPPRAVPARPVAAAEPAYAVSDEGAWRQRVLDRLDGLRTGLLVVGLIAVLGLGLAVWSLLREHQDRTSSRGGTSSAQVRSLRARVDSLESRLGSRATSGDLASLQRSQQALSQRVDGLSGAAAAKPSGGTTDAGARKSLNDLNQTVSTLSQSVSDLDQRVKSLESQSGGNTSTTP